MPTKRNTDLFSSLRSQGLRKSVARTLADIESSGRGARGRAEKLARQAIKDLRSAADTLEKRLDIGGVESRSRAAKKAATTRKRAATKRSAAAKKAASTRKSGAKRTTRKAGAKKRATKRS